VACQKEKTVWKKPTGQNKMTQDQTKKEALFNEVKGSLFEYLIAKKISEINNEELIFHQSLDQNYLNVLSQQDRMVRQFYPEMLPFLNEVSKLTAKELILFLRETPRAPRLMGKFSNSSLGAAIDEADLLVSTSKGIVPVSLKLNKRNAFVNTKSAGIKSFFTQYMSFIPKAHQHSFNQLVDMEFFRMAAELHTLAEMEYPGNFSHWVSKGHSELPGELGSDERVVLKAYYSRIAKQMHKILTLGQKIDQELFSKSLCPLLGFGSSEILQVICFHDFKHKTPAVINIHPFEEVSGLLKSARIVPFTNTSSVEIEIGNWDLQIRVKPMNKFTTTAIKINCSVKVKRPSDV
jgi:hypothetical protein